MNGKSSYRKKNQRMEGSNNQGFQGWITDQRIEASKNGKIK